MTKTTFALLMGVLLACLFALQGALAYNPSLTTEEPIVQGWLGVLMPIIITGIAFIMGGLVQTNTQAED